MSSALPQSFVITAVGIFGTPFEIRDASLSDHIDDGGRSSISTKSQAYARLAGLGIYKDKGTSLTFNVTYVLDPLVVFRKSSLSLVFTISFRR